MSEKGEVSGMTTLVNLVVMLGMFVVVPMGLRLIDGPHYSWLRPLWLVAAVPGAVSLWLPRGAFAASLAAVYATATLVLAVRAPLRLATSRSLAPRETAVLTALLTPSVAGLALVAERIGHQLFGFELTILALTVPHFHFAGFAAALTAGLVCAGRTGTASSSGSRAAALSVPTGTLLVLAGYFIGNWAELVGAVVLTAGMWLAGWLTWRDIRPSARSRTTRALLGTSAAVLAATMLLALWWAVGEAADIPHPTLTWMAATHGVGNALGFALCGLLAWQRLDEEDNENDHDERSHLLRGRSHSRGTTAGRIQPSSP